MIKSLEKTQNTTNPVGIAASKKSIPDIIDDNGTRNTHPLQKYKVALK